MMPMPKRYFILSLLVFIPFFLNWGCDTKSTPPKTTKPVVQPKVNKPQLDPKHRDARMEPLPDSTQVVFRDTINVEKAKSYFEPKKGYEVSLFASEKDFPISNPVSIDWDSEGRLWVISRPDLPNHDQLETEKYFNRIVLLEDQDQDGKADKHRVIAQKLENPSSIATFRDGAYLTLQGQLVYLSVEVVEGEIKPKVVRNFSTEDSERNIHSLTWGPDGALYFLEQNYLHFSENEEQPEPKVQGGHVWKFVPSKEDPIQGEFELISPYGLLDPQGLAFLMTGEGFIGAEDEADIHLLTPLMAGELGLQPHSFPKPLLGEGLFKLGSLLVLNSSHFPDAVQGSLVASSLVDKRAILNYEIKEEGSGFKLTEKDPLLLSHDPNFRPSDLKFSPEGYLTVSDYWSPLILKDAYKADDTRWDREYGRIWLVKKSKYQRVPKYSFTSEELKTWTLVDRLKRKEIWIRKQSVDALAQREPEEVLTTLKAWLKDQDEEDPQLEQYRLDAFRITERLKKPDYELLKKLHASKKPQIRAMAQLALGQHREQYEEALELLSSSTEDSHIKVRLAAALSLGKFDDIDALNHALSVFIEETDPWLEYTVYEALAPSRDVWLKALKDGEGFGIGNPKGVQFLIGDLEPEELLRLAVSEGVYRAVIFHGGVSIEMKKEALNGLAFLYSTSGLEQLLEILKGIEDEKSPVLETLARLLSNWEEEELTHKLDYWEDLSKNGKTSKLRSVAFAHWILVDGNSIRAWKSAIESSAQLKDFLAGFAEIREEKVRSSHFSDLVKIAKNEFKSEDGAELKITVEHQKLAVSTLEWVFGPEDQAEQKLDVFFTLIKNDDLVEPTLRALLTIPEFEWPEEKIPEWAQLVAEAVAKYPVEDQDTLTESIEFLESVLDLLPDDQQEAFGKKIEELKKKITPKEDP